MYLKKNPLQDLPSNLNAVISTNENTQIIASHVTYNPTYTYKFQLKTTLGFDDLNSHPLVIEDCTVVYARAHWHHWVS